MIDTVSIFVREFATRLVVGYYVTPTFTKLKTEMHPLNLNALTPLPPQLDSTVYRPYYTEANSLLVKPIIDGLIESPRSVQYAASQLNCSAATLMNKFIYGIKYLRENGTEQEQEKYRLFSAQFSVKRTKIGIQLTYKPNAVKLSSSLLATTGKTLAAVSISETWMDTFTEWLGRAKELDTFDSELIYGGRIPLDGPAEHTLIKLCAQIGAELDCNKEEGKFRVMR